MIAGSHAMPRIVLCALAMLLCASANAEGPISEKSPASPEVVLARKGLTRVRAKFLLDEGYALAKFKEADEKVAEFRESRAAYFAMIENDQLIKQHEQSISGLQRINGNLRNGMENLR